MLAKYKPLRANVSRAEVSTCFYVVSESTITTNHLAKTHLVAVLGLLKGVALSSSRTDPGGIGEGALSGYICLEQLGNPSRGDKLRSPYVWSISLRT